MKMVPFPFHLGRLTNKGNVGNSPFTSGESNDPWMPLYAFVFGGGKMSKLETVKLWFLPLLVFAVIIVGACIAILAKEGHKGRRRSTAN